jgi:hypothetical protein
MVKGSASLGSAVIDPLEVLGQTAIDLQGDNFRNLIRMELLYNGLHLVESILGGLHNEKSFPIIAHFTLPKVNRPYFRNDVYTCHQSRLNETMSDPRCGSKIVNGNKAYDVWTHIYSILCFFVDKPQYLV